MFKTSINAVVDRLEGDFAIIRTFDQQELLWPKNNLPSNVKEGSAVQLILKTDQELEQDQQKLAQAVLREVFNNE